MRHRLLIPQPSPPLQLPLSPLLGPSLMLRRRQLLMPLLPPLLLLLLLTMLAPLNSPPPLRKLRSSSDPLGAEPLLGLRSFLNLRLATSIALPE